MNTSLRFCKDDQHKRDGTKTLAILSSANGSITQTRRDDTIISYLSRYYKTNKKWSPIEFSVPIWG